LTSSPTEGTCASTCRTSPPPRWTDEQRLILRSTAGNVRDHTVISLVLGTGLRLAEIVGLNVGDVFLPDLELSSTSGYSRQR